MVCLSKEFKKVYNSFLADATLLKYSQILDRIQKGTLQIKSKSVYLQTKSALDKCRKAGIKVEYYLPEWNKRSDSGLKKHRIDKYVAPKDLELIFSHLPKTSKGKQLKLAINIAYYSACRLSEVLNLKKKDIQIKDKKPIRLMIIGKSQKFRITFLPRSMKESLMGFNEFDINVSYVEKTLKRVIRKCYQLNPYISFHSFRHSCAKNWIKKRLPLNKIQQFLGHEDLKTTSIYLKCIDENDHDIINIGY